MKIERISFPVKIKDKEHAKKISKTIDDFAKVLESIGATVNEEEENDILRKQNFNYHPK